jgi:hydroxymethylpyrimidine pyrophosphatase-like HAD family hydrolase
MEETETETLNHGGTECKQLSSEMAHGAPSFPEELIEFASNESDTTVIRKKFFEITGEQATRAEMIRLKSEIASENMEIDKASYTGDDQDYHEALVSKQYQIVNKLADKVIAGDLDVLKNYHHNVDVLHKLISKNPGVQNNFQFNFNKDEVLEAINAT